MDAAEHLRALGDAGHAFADLAAGAPLSTPIPTCPAWDVAALTRPLGTVHRWAATIVATPLHERPPFDPFGGELARPGPEDLVAWFGEGHATLLRALDQAPPDLD
ncbi:MAG: maleylpyruvate isomerase N-terminal domain-containing protein, partial [Solirubrobacteraceae bacterium]